MKTKLLGVKAPEKKADEHDQNCPFHGSLNVKKETFTGVVVKRDAHGTATIEWFRQIFVPKYERSEVRKSRMRAHNPPCVNAEVGQKVLVARTRPISKSKHHVIIQVLGTEKMVESEDITSKKKVSKQKEVAKKVVTKTEQKKPKEVQQALDKESIEVQETGVSEHEQTEEPELTEEVREE
ncbi:MAG: 30S ribosomal protein S17 [archaeon]